MVTRWGMSDTMGPVTSGQQDEEVFLGKDYNHLKDYSEETAARIDSAVREIVETAERRAETILQREIEKLHALSKTLIEKESLSGPEIAEILGIEQPKAADGAAMSATERAERNGKE
jgi:cell division protease FtsH